MRGRWRFGLAIVAVAALVHALFFFGWIIDDAYISFRYARNLAHGLGLVWNAGERVEGYTNFLWVLLCAASERLGVPAKTTAPLLGMASLAALAIVTAKLGAWLAGEGKGRTAAGLVAGGLVAASADAAFYAASGLETVLFALAVTSTMYAALARRPLAFALAGAVAVLVRPEGALACAVGLLALASSAKSEPALRRPLARAVIVLALAAVAYAAFKWTYFGGLVPNTALVKLDTGIAGPKYLWRQLPRWGWLLAPSLAGAYVLRSAPARWLGVFVLAVLGAIAIEGFDWMPLGRFLVPLLGPAAALVGALVARVVRSSEGRARVFAGAALAALAVGFAVMVLRDGRQVADRNAVMMVADAGRRRMFRDLAARGYRSAATFDIGLLGYEAPEMTVIDLGGLTDRVIGRAPGWYFDKHVPPAYLAERAPDLLLFTTNSPPKIDLARGTLSLESLYPSEDRVKQMPWFQRSYEYVGTATVHPTISISAFARRR